MLEILLVPKDRRTKVWNILQIILFVALYFVSVLSSGLYVFACGIIPIIFYFFLNRDKYPDMLKQVSSISFTICFLTAIGYIIQKKLNLSTLTERMELVSVQDLFPKIKETVTALVSITDALPYEKIPAYSLPGFIYAVKFVLVIGIISLSFSGFIRKEVQETSN